MKSLSKEVTLTLALKLLLLYLLWYVCFSHPVTKQLKADQFVEHIVGSVPFINDSTHSISGGNHDSRS